MVNKLVKISMTVLLAMVILIGCILAAVGIPTVSAETAETQNISETVEVTTFDYGTDIVTQTIRTVETLDGVECEFELSSKARGLFCTIAVSIKGDREGEVTGIAKNTFTLGYSTIPVHIVLWSASSKGGIDLDIDPEAHEKTDDLNIFKTVECSADTDGIGRYWQAHAYWNFDNQGWEHGQTPVSYYDANAVYNPNL